VKTTVIEVKFTIIILIVSFRVVLHNHSEPFTTTPKYTPNNKVR